MIAIPSADVCGPLQITPDADLLHTAISGTFSDRPGLHWSTVLGQIVDGTEVGDVAG
jgi:hypothetical protein